MPRSRIRVSKRQDWDSENMRIAVKEVVEKRMTFRNACIQFNVPKSTNDAECLYCGESYSTSTEGWVQCRVCKKWAHCSCAGEDDNDKELYHICDICKQVPKVK